MNSTEQALWLDDPRHKRTENEVLYREWARQRGKDPEDTETMRGYEEWYAWEHGQ